MWPKCVYFLCTTARTRGIYNLGSGKARTFLDLTRAVFKAMSKAEQIEFIDTPMDIRDKYQYFTEANMDKLKGTGYPVNFHSMEQGINEYIQKLMAPSIH